MTTVQDPGVYWAEGEVEAAVDTLLSGGLLLAKGDIGYGLFGTSAGSASGAWASAASVGAGAIRARSSTARR